MTLQTGTRVKRSNFREDGFTLIELILVMSILLIVISVSAPSLQRFFKGRNLDSETRRLAGLTKYGQSRAVSEGIPMVLWIDQKRGYYGLQAASGYLDYDDKAVEFTVDKNLQLESQSLTINSASNTPAITTVEPGLGNVPMIRFGPDGSIAENSPYLIQLSDKRQADDVAWIGLAANRLRYEILANNVYTRQK
jgi:type II secretion system protein H